MINRKSRLYKKMVALNRMRFCDQVRAEIVCLAARTQVHGPVRWGVWNALRMNSYERHWLLPFVGRAALVCISQQVVAQCQHNPDHPSTTYEQAAVVLLHRWTKQPTS